ncbi:hypothetical protein WMF26_31140 [Sorangium sp. So ce185]|uniref:hypothetical protein n=1 Tax=Sorangium sp. So ce185 TaxID=3133287 RepID=UPI003F5EA1DA
MNPNDIEQGEVVRGTPILEASRESSLSEDPVLEQAVRVREELDALLPIGQERGGGDDWDAPLDLRVARPLAVVLDTFSPAGQVLPAFKDRKTVLIIHVVTPFARDGHSPDGVWGLGYEFVMKGVDASTVAVLPNDEVLQIARVGQELDIELGVGGEVTTKGMATDRSDQASLSLHGARLRASTTGQLHLSLRLSITLRKVLGAPVGIGGAQWKMYRQDEPMDRPHTLLQTVLLPKGVDRISCVIKTWVRRAGVLGTTWRAKFWPYQDLEYSVPIHSLARTWRPPMA